MGIPGPYEFWEEKTFSAGEEGPEIIMLGGVFANYLSAGDITAELPSPPKGEPKSQQTQERE